MSSQVMRIVAGLAVVGVASAAAVSYWALRDAQPADGRVVVPEPVDDPAKPQQYIYSESFAQLPVAQRLDYLAQHREQIGQELRRYWRYQMQRTVDGYFALPEDQREAYLDRVIDEMEQFREAMRQRRPEGDQNRREDMRRRWERMSRDERKNLVRDRWRERIEEGTPEQRAKMSAFFRALANRRAQRGLGTMWGGRGRRG